MMSQITFVSAAPVDVHFGGTPVRARRSLSASRPAYSAGAGLVSTVLVSAERTA